MQMKKFINDPENLTAELLEGLALANPDILELGEDNMVINKKLAEADRVTIVTQGGSGHEPAIEGFVGEGMVDIDVVGDIFAAPGPQACVDAIKLADKGKGDWRVAQIGDWFDNGEKTGPDGGSGVVALKGIEHKAEAMKFLDWFNTQIDDLTSQGLVVAATTGSAKTPASWSEFYGGQDVMAEFATANGNLASFSYIPGFSAVDTAMKEKAADAADGKAKVETIFDAAQTASVDTLKDYGLSVAQ